MQNKLLSIIVPVYNVEPYLHRCIDSILAQTYTNYECILIDDGSTDDSGRICEEYAARYNRLKVIHQQNKGVSSARNAGLNATNGKYIGFVDPDDWIEPDMYEILISEIKSKNVDLAICGYEDYNENNTILKRTDYHNSSLDIEESFCFCLYNDSVWNKLFRQELIGNTRFDNSYAIGEDCRFLFEIIPNIEQCSVIDRVLYHRLIRSTSATQAANVEKHVTSLPVHETVVAIGKKIGDKAFYQAQAKYLDVCLQYYKSIRAANTLKKYVRENAFTLLRNPNIYWKTKILYVVNSVLVFSE